LSTNEGYANPYAMVKRVRVPEQKSQINIKTIRIIKM
jgi:hypothetical protein